MKKLRSRNLWFRVVPAVALGATLSIGFVGCDDDKPMNPPPPPPGGNLSLSPATTGGSYTRPFDAVPDSMANTFYFIATDTSNDAGNMAVFKVSAAGGAAQKLFAGAPLVSPFGLAISADDGTLFIADRETAGKVDAEGGSIDGAKGAIYKLSVSGGTPMVLSGTEGYGPRAAEVVGNDLYFTGIDPTDAQAGVFKVSTGGGTPAKVAKGAPITDPSGITLVGSDVYVADSLTETSSFGNIIKISGGTASVFLKGISMGFPAGIAATMDGSRLLVSAQSKETGGSVVSSINIATKEVTDANQGIETSTDSGGLHRAQKANVLSWCGVTSGSGGTVFRVEFK